MSYGGGMMKTEIQLGNPETTTHLYAVEIEVCVTIDVYANNRSQAVKIARDAGFTVRSVNMIG